MNNKTGIHSEWRKLAKKLRRKRIRQRNAQLKEEIELQEFKRLENSPSYHALLAEKIKAEERHKLEEARVHDEKEKEWLKVEEEAQKQFQELKKKLAIAREERERQNEIIKLEWEEEQKRRKEKQKEQEEELQKQIKHQELLNAKVEEFLEYGGDTPEHLKISLETNPNKPLCPFFQKTATCRFFDVCSRNHVRPGISRILLIPNFFSHYSLEKTENEHFTDSNLEFETQETNEVYSEFFQDVVPEFEKYGKIGLFITCCNHEAHLRGNVFVEFMTTQAALQCYRGLNGRWYGGKQLSLQFASIPNWRSAICGVHFSNRCPKGTSCNFIHTFRNPRSTYSVFKKIRRNNESSQRNNSETRNWRWSESPERLPITDDWEEESNSNSSRHSSNSVRNGDKKDWSSDRKRRKSRSKKEERNNLSSRSAKRSRDKLRSRSKERDKSPHFKKYVKQSTSSRKSDSSRRSERFRYS